MFTVIKKQGKTLNAYELGKAHPVLAELQAAGRLRALENGDFEIFSRETLDGAGEIAHPGDYLKLDCGGWPYPNSRAFFLKNHRHIQGDMYEQLPKPLTAWERGEPMGEEMTFLLEKKGLTLSPQTPERYFSAPLWGTILSAGEDALVVFYALHRDEQGRLTDADFNLVAREEFHKTYRRL